MDAAGAEELRKRLAAHEHWREATAVQKGQQSASDPDAGTLDEIVDGVRYYEPDGGEQMRKTLVDGSWCTEIVEIAP